MRGKVGSFEEEVTRPLHDKRDKPLGKSGKFIVYGTQWLTGYPVEEQKEVVLCVCVCVYKWEDK